MKLVLSGKMKIIDISEKEVYSKMSISQIAYLIRDDWGEKISRDAKPYLNALYAIEKITDDYYCESGTWIVAYFLSNAGTWRGPVARAIKKELNMRLQKNRNR